MRTLIEPGNHAVLWAVIAAGTALAIWLEQTCRWASKLSAPVLALLIAMLLSNTHLVPAESPAYDFVGDWLVPLALPLLLFRANLREILKTGGRMFLVFHVSSIGTLIGTGLAVWALRGRIGSRVSTIVSVAAGSSASKGSCPVRQRYRIAPTE